MQIPSQLQNLHLKCIQVIKQCNTVQFLTCVIQYLRRFEYYIDDKDMIFSTEMKCMSISVCLILGWVSFCLDGPTSALVHSFFSYHTFFFHLTLRISHLHSIKIFQRQNLSTLSLSHNHWNWNTSLHAKWVFSSIPLIWLDIILNNNTDFCF